MQASVSLRTSTSGRAAAPAAAPRLRAGASSRRAVAMAAAAATAGGAQIKFWKYHGLGNDFILVRSAAATRRARAAAIDF
jgi:hypothetical protein